MHFVNPLFLWALAFVAVPVIVHLFYFRRYKRILFSNTQFLQEIKEERSSRNKLKHLLVLFSRIFAIIFLVLAFAQPFIPSGKNDGAGEQVVSIFIDNSFSMQAEGNGMMLFDEAKTAAKQVLGAYTDNVRFQILTNDFEGKHQRLVSKAEAFNLITEIYPSAASQEYAAVFERQKNLLKNEPAAKTVYLISDFQQNKKIFENDTNFSINLVPLVPSQVRNVFIDSVWFYSPIQLKGETNTLLVKTRNESKEKVSGTFQLNINGAAKSVVNYEIDAQSYSIDTMAFNINEKGWNKGLVSLNDYPITFDDTYYFTFFVEDEVRVLNIFNTGKSDRIFKSIFQELPHVVYQSTAVTNINYNDLPGYHAIILDGVTTIPSGLTEALKSFTENGGNVLVIPSSDFSIESYNQFLSAVNAGLFGGVVEGQRLADAINYQHPALNDLFDRKPENIKLPSVSKYYPLRSGTYTSEEILFSFKNGDSFMSSFENGRGKIYVATASLENSDFSTNALFAPLVYKIAILGVNNANISFNIGANTLIEIQNMPLGSEEVVKLSNENSEIIPQKMVYGGKVLLNVAGVALTSGYYNVTADKTDLNEWVALNYDRSESFLRYYSESQLLENFIDDNVRVIKGNIAKIASTVKQLEQGKTFWKLCIVLSLLFLAIEILLLRFLRG